MCAARTRRVQSPEGRQVGSPTHSQAVSATCGFTSPEARDARGSRGCKPAVHGCQGMSSKIVRMQSGSLCYGYARGVLHMKMLAALVSSVMLGAFLAAAQQPPQPPAPQQPMSFFVTSVGLGNGANLGGLAGADRHCQALATAAGGGAKTWHAYLSVSASGGQAAVNARDRIGSGPWYSAKGGRIAQNVGDLHGDTIEQA